MRPFAAPRGFARLITIVPAAFLVIVLVDRATFTRVKTPIPANSRQVAQTRQNALAGLNIALGEPPASTAPDQRASADILETTPTPPSPCLVKTARAVLV
ncbi:MAG: hypothetical protein H7067_03080 [Burkholderiales bacterium]|nr:hypothetical protein [Opitutaceae bacterium]